MASHDTNLDRWFENNNQLGPSGAPNMMEDEFPTIHNISEVHIYYGNQKVFRDGNAKLTSHRLLWSHDNIHKQLPLRYVDSVDTKTSYFSNPQIILTLKTKMWQPNVSIPGQAIQPNDVLKLSFHTGKKDFNNCVKCLNDALVSKAWTKVKAVAAPTGPVVGIAGLKRRQKENQKKEKQQVNEAFGDLESLMEQARVMVTLANKLKSTKDAQDNADEFDTLLGDLGVVSPVTKEAAGGQYHRLLAEQVCDFMHRPIDQTGGIMNLVDAYCMYNKARGTELVSPDDFKQACKKMASLNLPIILKKLPGGILVLCNRNSIQYVEQVLALLEVCEYVDEVIVSTRISSVSVNMAKRVINQCESQGSLARDVGPQTTHYYKNLFDTWEPTFITV